MPSYGYSNYDGDPTHSSGRATHGGGRHNTHRMGSFPLGTLDDDQFYSTSTRPGSSLEYPFLDHPSEIQERSRRGHRPDHYGTRRPSSVSSDPAGGGHDHGFRNEDRAGRDGPMREEYYDYKRAEYMADRDRLLYDAFRQGTKQSYPRNAGPEYVGDPRAPSSEHKFLGHMAKWASSSRQNENDLRGAYHRDHTGHYLSFQDIQGHTRRIGDNRKRIQKLDKQHSSHQKHYDSDSDY